MERNERRGCPAPVTIGLFTLIAFGVWLLVGLGPAVADEEEKKEEEKKEFAADKGPDSIDVKGYPAKIRSMYKTFASKCSRCHTLARPINTDMSAGAWMRYVKRMMNKPDSGISPKLGKQIYQFLKFHQAKKDEKKKAKEEKSE
ncbi:MAG: hypothetical protein HYY84_06540 [Deltaproteobacteria bacterium]|nr:hypothetical protein [Deltaproteobacteria bacterium]